MSFKRTCLFCIIYRPNCAPNLITVQVQNSDGICPTCDERMRAKAGLKPRLEPETVALCHGPAGACVLPFGTHENHIFLDEWINDPTRDFTFPEDGGRF